MNSRPETGADGDEAAKEADKTDATETDGAKAAKPVGKPSKKSGSKKGPKDRAPAAPVRDETDSFIDEVTEELRRDRLYAMFRRYGPYALALIVALVVGAAVNEYAGAQRIEAARQAGAALIEAQKSDEPAAAYLSAAAEAGPGAAMIARFNAAALRAEQGDIEAAASIYRGVAVEPDLAPRFRDLALLKAAMVEADSATPDELIATLEPLTAAGAPYRPLALELQAAAYLRKDDPQAAREALTEAMNTPGAPQSLVGRAQAVIEALGGDPEAPTAPIPADGAETPPASGG